MKRLCFNPAFLLILLIVTVPVQAAGWHSWSQSARNQHILDETYSYVNDYVGQSCKVWVQTIVSDASGGAATVPPNHPSLYMWYSGDDVAGRSGPIEFAVPGEIVQMLLSDGVTPHTAIVLGISSGGITFVESNWQNDEVVRIRNVPFSTFYNQVSAYTIYQIL